jgi:long-subunit fatty acid transport protein
MRVAALGGLMFASVSAVVVDATFSGAQAEYAQTLGIGQKSTNLGGAVTATADDYDVFYTNPAGAANFSSVFIGVGVKTLDTRTLSAKQVDAAPVVSSGIADFLNSFLEPDFFETPANGVDVSPSSTLPGQAIAFVPSLGAYAPLPTMPNVVVGIGFGAPFVVSGNFDSEGKTGSYAKFNATDASILVLEAAPTIGVRVSDRLNIGASLGITTLKYLRLAADFGSRVGTGTVASAGLETDSDFGVPFAPTEFSTSPTDVSFTLGLQYKLTPRLTFGATYRSETPQTFEGPVSVAVSPIGFDGFAPLGGFTQQGRFTLDLELPRHLQLGLAYEASDRWRIMADARWNNWSDTKGFGSPAVFKISGIDIGGAIQDQLPLIGGVFGLPPSANIKTLTIPYAAEDTISLHFGTSYKITPQLELQAGYVYDPAFMPEETADLISFSSNRHIFSLGGTYTQPTASGGEWAFTLGGQVSFYEDRTIDPGESATAGGVNNSVEAILTGETDLSFQPNTLGGLELGGYVWSVGASVSYRFGQPRAALEPVK